MRRTGFGTGMALAIGLLLVAGSSTVRGEDSGAFKNGANILQAQEILVEDGYLSQGAYSSGVLDDATRKALGQYQSVHALNSDGILDDETFQSLTSHGATYPWDSETVVGQAEPVVSEPAPTVEVAQAPPAPEPTPAPVEVKEAPAQEAPAAAPEEPAKRRMPATGSSLPLLALVGLGLMGGGALLLRQRAV
jgi:LPXTG-motif cell wall-anchored protein